MAAAFITGRSIERGFANASGALDGAIPLVALGAHVIERIAGGNSQCRISAGGLAWAARAVGRNVRQQGTNFSLFSEVAEQVELRLFDDRETHVDLPR
jgi:hypothetical protein